MPLKNDLSCQSVYLFAVHPDESDGDYCTIRALIVLLARYQCTSAFFATSIYLGVHIARDRSYHLINMLLL